MTATMTTGALALCKEDLVALREADQVVFESYPGRDGLRITQIRAIRERRSYDDSPVVFTAREQRVFTRPVDMAPAERMRPIPAVPTWTFHGSERGDEDKAVAFSMEHTARFHREWQTIAGLLRVGDELVLGWVADNGNGYTRDAGLMRDELHLTIRRGDESLRFLVDVSVCAPNSARMVKPNGY